MANFFNLILDTTSPAGVSISIEGGAQYATQQLVSVAFSTTDAVKTGYQMKVWGDVDPTHDPNVAATEAASQWITFAASKQVKLEAGDGSKRINVKLRDDVYNESEIAFDTILVDLTKPVVTVTSPDVTKISKMPNKNVASFSFTSDSEFTEYKVKVVSSSGASHDTGVVIPTTGGSTNTSGTGTFPAATPIDSQINGVDLESVSSGDGNKIIKVFVKDAAGNWSS